MRRVAWALMVIGLAAAPCAFWPHAMGQGLAREPRPIPSRRTALTIPFRITPATSPLDQPVEVQLMVSANRGLAWKHAGSASPQAGKIAFSAPGDGEYWFCVKTKDTAGRIRPPGPPRAELRVLVDSTPPQLRVNAWRGVDGDVTARWDATDANLNPQTFKIEYRRSGTSEPWQALSVKPPLADARGSYADTITWKSTTAVDVQVEIADVAGNVSRQIVEANTATSTPLAGLRAAQETGPAQSGATPNDSAQQSRSLPQIEVVPPIGPAPQSEPPRLAISGGPPAYSPANPGTMGVPSTSLGSPFAPGSRAPVDLPWRNETATATPWPAEAAQTSRIPARSWDTGPIAPGGPAFGGTAAPAGTGTTTPGDPFAARQESSPAVSGAPATTWPPVAQRASPFPSRGHELGMPFGSGGSPPSSPNTAGQPSLPGGMNPFSLAAGAVTPGASGTPAQGGTRPCLVNSRVLEIAYDLGSTAPADVRAVELWGTNDGGQSWRRMAADDDNRSPVTVKVDTDGVYGFRLLVQRQSGPIEFPPAAGQAPELVVEVDQTEPRCHLTRVDQLAGPRSGELVIAWEASDRRLAERPVTLRWSHRPDGPWRTIAAGLDNTGSYTWLMPDSLPAEVYLRLEVRDAADNVGQFTAERPVTPQPAKPAGRLRSVVPANPGRITDQRSEPRMYFFR